MYVVYMILKDKSAYLNNYAKFLEILSKTATAASVISCFGNPTNTRKKGV